MNESSTPDTRLLLRAATAADQREITHMIRRAGLNPLSLGWPRFLIAEEAGRDKAGRIVGIGQVKQHGDGSRELASIAVIPERQGQGIASRIIQALLAREPGALYLTCRPELETFYNRFGFRPVTSPSAMPPYFRRIYRLVQFLAFLGPRAPHVSVMLWTGPGAQIENQD